VARRDSTVAAVRHAVEILRGFSTHDAEQGISEIARRIGLHKSSVSRLVSTLEQDRLIERDPDTRRVRLGVGLIGLAAPLLANVKVVEVARPYLVQLARDAGETISLSVWDGVGAVSLEQALGGKAIAHYAPPGRHNPAHCTASGKLLLAHAPAAEFDRIVAGDLKRYTARTICDSARLSAEIRAIRTRAYALNTGEFALDVGAVAAPVRSAAGNVIAAITATVPMYRFDVARRPELISLVTQCAKLLSTRLHDLNLQRIES